MTIKNKSEQENRPTGFVLFPAFDWSLGPMHPEREERLLYTSDLLLEEGILDLPCISVYNPVSASDETIQAVHACLPSPSHHLTDAHRIASGGALVLGDALCSGSIRNGFAAIRPPGHHAFRLSYGNRGFCNINNMAVLVQHIRYHHGIRKIAIVDTDVHHADGTQNIFWHDPDVLVVSIHQDGRTQYPGTGFTSEFGSPAAPGLTLNLPLPPGAGENSYNYLMKNCILPILKDFQPDVILNSAGQDSHFSDPLGSMQMTAQAYANMISLLQPDLILLEGGYSVELALPYAHLALLASLAGLPSDQIVEPVAPSTPIREPEGCSKWVDQLSQRISELYFRRSLIRKNLQKNKYTSFERDIRVFYDTDGIIDWEKEILKPCEQCPGLLEIRSEARFASGEHLKTLVLTLPWHACPDCRASAEVKIHENIRKSGEFDFVFYQDLQYNVGQFEKRSSS